MIILFHIFFRSKTWKANPRESDHKRKNIQIIIIEYFNIATYLQRTNKNELCIIKAIIIIMMLLI